MAIEDAVLEKLRSLPPEQQLAVLEFATSLAREPRDTPVRRPLRGLCADLKIRITEEEIDEARREMWGSFPREDI